ncbi:MBL fold metallo-hydrolase [uncultured Paludibaculum sp.]|uniref:MBL fold metallo-hydrolase n=1 Tax=uncultured Paludibaculum sp. TaxID=1765020 RepID=UPI002AAC3864|nr:MBL fold metallo-hydrolase [uncultured Paludibaculum sp.]
MSEYPLTLTYIGGPTVLIEFGPVRLLTDPTFDPAGGDYTTGPVTLHKLAGPALSAAEVGSFDYVLLSHDHHFDNLDHAGRELLTHAKLVLTTEEGASRLGGNSVGLHNWQTLDLASADGRTLRVVAAPGRHGPQGMDRGAVIGFVLYFTDAPERCIYFSGDTVWYEGVAEVGRRFPIRTAILNLGAARVPEVGSFHLTMTAEEAVQVAQAFQDATIVPLHFEGWRHFSEGKNEIALAFAAASLTSRLCWPELGGATRVVV